MPSLGEVNFDKEFQQIIAYHRAAFHPYPEETFTWFLRLLLTELDQKYSSYMR